MLRDRLEPVLRLEHHLPGEQVVSDAAHGVDVGARIDLLSQRDLRRHVGRRSRGQARRGLHRVGTESGDRLHQPEVQHLHEVVAQADAADVDVRGLDVAMHEARCMRLLQRLA
jgi:hypothetical protein